MRSGAGAVGAGVVYTRRRSSLLGSRVAVTAAIVLSLAGCTSIPPGRSAVDAVEIQGARTLDSDDVEEKMATARTDKFLGLFRGVVYDYEVYDPSVLQRDMARIERYYRGKGFLEAHARASRVEQVSAQHIRVDITVEEGPPTLNRDLRIDGIDGVPPIVLALARAAAAAKLPKGQRFDEDAYRDAKVALKKTLTDQGYAYATVAADAKVDIGARTADYFFTVQTGPIAKFGKITIVGLDPDGKGPRPQEIDEAPLRRAINITEGEQYSTADIDVATQALLDLEVFSAVQIEPELPQPPPANPVVPLKVSVEPTRLRQIRAGVGAEFDEIKTDIHLLAGWEDHNFLGGLRDLSIDFRPGVVLYPLRLTNVVTPNQLMPEERLKVQFRQPSFLEAHTSGFIKPEFNVFPFLVQPNPPANDPVIGYVEAKGAAGVDRPFFNNKLFVTLSYNEQLEVPITYLATPGSRTPPQINLAYPQLVTKLDYRDDPIHPRSGFYIANDFQIAAGALASSAHDVRVQPEVRGYVPIGRRVVLAARASVGFLFASNYSIAGYLPDKNLAAADDRTRAIEEVYFRGFFSGGPSTNRGFPLRGIAPYGYVPFLLPAAAAVQVANHCDPGSPTATSPQCDLPIAGFTLWELSQEARFDISGPFSAAIFCDMGDVSPNQADIRLSHLHLACGAGARYDTPVGPIRLDIGYRIQPLQVLGYKDEIAAGIADPVNGPGPPRFFYIPLAIALGIGEAY